MATNNTFRKATDLGSFTSTKVLRAKDAIGSTDKADVFKFTVEPTTGFRASSSFKSKGGPLTVSFFLVNPLTGKPTAIPSAPPTVIKAGKTATPFNLPATNIPLTFFVKFDKPTQEVNYRFALKPIA